MTLNRWSALDSRPFAAVAFLLIASGMWISIAVNRTPALSAGVSVPLNGYIYASYALAICSTAWLLQCKRSQTDKSALADELRALQKQLLVVTDQAGVTVLSVAPDGRVQALYGASLPKSIGCEVGGQVDEVFRSEPELVARIQNGLDHGGPCSGTIVSAGRFLKIEARPRPNPDGALDGLLIVVRDDTRRRADKEAVARAMDEMNRSKGAVEFFRRESLTPTAMFDGDGRMVDANPAFCGLLGYGAEEILVRSTEELTHPEDIGKSIETMLTLRSGTADYAQLTKRYVCKDGSILRAATHLALSRDENGRILNVLAQLVLSES